MKRIAVFCGARPGRDNVYLAVAAQAGRTIARAGFGVVYGGGRVGMMGALADAALDEGAEVIGVIPESLATVEIAHRGITQLRVVESMHERKALIVSLSDAFVALPGGIGTIASVPRLMVGQGTIVATGSIAYPVGLGEIKDEHTFVY